MQGRQRVVDEEVLEGQGPAVCLLDCASFLTTCRRSIKGTATSCSLTACCLLPEEEKLFLRRTF